MNPKILLIGRSGQIGGDLGRLLPNLGTVISPSRDQLDLSNPLQIRERIAEIKPRWIVNAAAYTAVDQAESDQADARAINAEAPRVLAEEAKKVGSFLVHFSTDYVFDGAKKSPYQEADASNPLNVYGETKLEGEEAIRASDVPHIIFRTSWVYGTRGNNFLHTILRLAIEREELRIVQDQIGAPTWSHEIAAATAEILRVDVLTEKRSSLNEKTGTYHMTASGQTTWYEFASAILEETSALPPGDPWLKAVTKGRPLIAQRVIPIRTSEYPTPAKRPANSLLSNALLTRTFGVSLPEWREQLKSAFARRNE